MMLLIIEGFFFAEGRVGGASPLSPPPDTYLKRRAMTRARRAGGRLPTQ